MKRPPWIPPFDQDEAIRRMKHIVAQFRGRRFCVVGPGPTDRAVPNDPSHVLVAINAGIERAKYSVAIFADRRAMIDNAGKLLWGARHKRMALVPHHCEMSRILARLAPSVKGLHAYPYCQHKDHARAWHDDPIGLYAQTTVLTAALSLAHKCEASSVYLVGCPMRVEDGTYSVVDPLRPYRRYTHDVQCAAFRLRLQWCVARGAWGDMRISWDGGGSIWRPSTDELYERLPKRLRASYARIVEQIRSARGENL